MDLPANGRIPKLKTSETTITEVYNDVFRISTYMYSINLTFSQFLIRDEQPLLYHTGMNAIFPQVRDAVATVIDPSTIRWISFSHFEIDECGSLNQWLRLAPNAEVISSMVTSFSLNDLMLRRMPSYVDGMVIETGKYRFRYMDTCAA